MVNRSSCWRECKRLEFLVQQLLQVVLCGDADRHVRVELRASFIRHKGLHILDGWLIDIWVFLRGDKRRCGPLLRRERGDGVEQLLLIPDEVVGWLNNDPAEA